MLRSNLFDRALPWSRVLLSMGKAAPGGLNVTRAGKLSVVAMFVSLLAMLTGLATIFVNISLAASAFGVLLAAIMTFSVLNRSFLQLVGRRIGYASVLPALGLLALHFAMSGFGYSWAILEHLTGDALAS